MLTAALLAAAARTRGIFAVPTRAGETGPVLLASLGLDLEAPGVVFDLLVMHRRGEIVLAPVDGPIDVSISLGKRDVPVDLRKRSEIDDDPYWYHALLVEAVAVTGDGLTEEQIESYRVDDDGIDCHIALGHDRGAIAEEVAEARDRIAVAINHRRGVL